MALAGDDRIELRGLRVVGAHGVLPEERDRPQPFEIDVDLELDLVPAGRSDALADTVDYGAVAAAVAAVVGGRHADLLEHLAERIAAAALSAAGPAPGRSRPAATAVTVSVRKLRPPLALDIASTGVTIRRRAVEGPPGAVAAGDSGTEAETDAVGSGR